MKIRKPEFHARFNAALEAMPARFTIVDLIAVMGTPYNWNEKAYASGLLRQKAERGELKLIGKTKRSRAYIYEKYEPARAVCAR